MIKLLKAVEAAHPRGCVASARIDPECDGRIIVTVKWGKWPLVQSRNFSLPYGEGMHEVLNSFVKRVTQ